MERAGFQIVIKEDGTKELYKNGTLQYTVFTNSKEYVEWYVNGEFIKQITREKYDKLLRLYPAIQLYRKKSAVENSSFYKKWNKSKILEPLLTGMIIVYM